MNVLFITTNEALWSTASEILGGHGMDVVKEESIAEAKTVLEEEHPDFVVIDEHVDGGTAFDFFNYVLEYHPDTPAVIFATSMTREEMQRRPEKVISYEPENLELALDDLADLIETAVQFKLETLYPEPEDEADRLTVLNQFDFDALQDAPFYDRLTRKGAETFDVPMCYVGVIEQDQERFLSCHGTTFNAIAREQTICSYAIITDDVMVVDDVQNDPRFRDMEAIQNLDLKWYASAPITIDGHRIGTFCIADTEKHAFTDEDKERLRALADEFAEELSKHRKDT